MRYLSVQVTLPNILLLQLHTTPKPPNPVHTSLSHTITFPLLAHSQNLHIYFNLNTFSQKHAIF